MGRGMGSVRGLGTNASVHFAIGEREMERYRVNLGVVRETPEEIMELKARMFALPSVAYDGAPKAKAYDFDMWKACVIDDKDSKVAKLLRAEIEIERAEAALSKLDKGDRELLERFYLNGSGRYAFVDDMAKEFGFTVRHMYRVIYIAAEKFGAIFAVDNGLVLEKALLA